MKARILWLSVMLVAVGTIWQLGSKLTKAFASDTKTPARAEALPLPTEFDDTYQVDADLLAGVRDFTVLDNDQIGGRPAWDRGFWACLQAVLKLSPDEINRRAEDVIFDTIKGYADEDQAARDALRGRIVKIRGKYNPDLSRPYTQLEPDNPTGRQRIRIGAVISKDIPDALRTNTEEAWVVYFLDDTGADRNDIVEVEGVFLKVLKFKSQLEHKGTILLPMLVARTPRVIKKAPIGALIKRTGDPRFVAAIAGAATLSGIMLLLWVAIRHRRQSRFKEDVLKKIRDRKAQRDNDVPET